MNAESTKQAKDAERKSLIAAFETEFSKYGPWTFDYMYPGCFSYYRTVEHGTEYNGLNIFFTPDWAEEDEVSIQITTAGGYDVGGGDNVPFKERTAKALFEIVKPWLDKHATVCGCRECGDMAEVQS